jgi:hypothetical protein
MPTLFGKGVTAFRAYMRAFSALYASIGVEQQVPVERAGFGIVAPETVEVAPFKKYHCSDTWTVNPGKPLKVEDVYLYCTHLVIALLLPFKYHLQKGICRLHTLVQVIILHENRGKERLYYSNYNSKHYNQALKSGQFIA